VTAYRAACVGGEHVNEAARPRAVVFVEGISDQLAVTALARRRGRSLDAEGIAVVPIGGAHAIGPFLETFGPRGLGLTLAGLCDAGELGAFMRAPERAGLGADLTREAMAALGFYVCVPDPQGARGRRLRVSGRLPAAAVARGPAHCAARRRRHRL